MSIFPSLFFSLLIIRHFLREYRDSHWFSIYCHCRFCSTTVTSMLLYWQSFPTTWLITLPSALPFNSAITAFMIWPLFLVAITSANCVVRISSTSSAESIFGAYSVITADGTCTHPADPVSLPGRSLPVPSLSLILSG